MILHNIGVNLGIENKNNFEIVLLKTKNRFIWNFWSLSRYLRKNPTNIYLTQYITPWFVPKKIKMVTIIHDISFNFFPEFIKWSDLFFLKILIPKSLERAGKIIAVSRFTREEIIKYYKTDPEKVIWIHNAVSEEFLRRTRKITCQDKDETRKKYSLPKKFILYLGTHEPRKNLPVLVEAFSKLPRTDLGLVIAGGQGRNYDKKIEAAVKKNNLQKKIIFPGYIKEEDKAALMAAASVFCLPSFYEGFGIPILEAMSAGVPVIASDIAPHREIAGDAAVFFNPNEPGELVEKIEELLNNKPIRENLILKGSEQAQKFSWKTTAQRLLEILERV